MKPSHSKSLERQGCLSLAAARVTALAIALAFAGCGADSVESLTASGQALAAKKDYKGAVIQFKTALQKDPQSAEARALLGQALLDASDPAAAAAELTRALDQKVDAARVVPSLARAYLLTGEYKKLTSQFGDLQLADAKALASLKTSVATAWAAQGDRARTETALAAALAAQADFPPALVLQARTEAGQGRFERATALVDEALKLDSRLYEAWHLKGEILLVGKRDQEAALKAFREALNIEPAYLPSHMALIAERINARDVPGAQALANELRKVLPKHPQTVYVDAQLAFSAGDLKKARELSQMLLRALPENSGVLMLAGAVEGQSGALVVAESHYAKALQLNPSLPLARRNLGQVYLRLGQPQKTLDTLRPLLDAGVQDPVVLAMAGEAHLKLGDLTAAEAAFRQAATLQPDNTRVRTALALAHLGRGDAETAFAELATVASQSEKDTFADQAIISARLSRREFDLALKAADTMVSKAPAKASALELRGRVQSFRKDYVAARQDFELALKADPALFSATVYLAGLDILEEKPAQARQRLQTSVDTDPKNYFARLALAATLQSDGAPLEDVRKLLTDGIRASPAEPGLRLQLVDLLLVKRQFKDALAAAQEAVAALPADSRLLDALGRAQMDAGDVEQSISTFRRLADKDPRDPTAHVRLADIYKGTNRQPAAESALRRALEIDPGLPRAQESLASMMLRDGRLKEASELARKIQAQRPRSTSGYSLETTVLMRQKQVDAALAVFRRGLAVKDHEPELARQYYVTLQRAGREAEADRFAVTWMRSHPNDLVFEYQLGVAAMERSDWAQAEARYLRVVQSLPKQVMALNNLAWVMSRRGKSGGSAYAQRAVDLAPNSPELMDTLALALMVDKQPAKALELQKKVVELRPTEPAYRLSLARMALEAGDKALARAELERLKALGASYPQQAEVSALAQKL